MKKDFSDSYSDEAFWKKIKTLPSSGCNLLRTSLTLYVLLLEPSTPIWAKGLIVGALAYLIVIPDFLADPIYIDDLSIMSTLIASQLYGYLNSDIRGKVNSMLPARCRAILKVEPTYKS